MSNKPEEKMSEDIYKKLAKVLDTLPNGYPSTENGTEIKILKIIFSPEEADLFCNLRLTLETAEQISARTGLQLEGLQEKLFSMWEKGQIFCVPLGDIKLYKMMPWVFGIYEFQLKFLTKELVELCEEYMDSFGEPFFKAKPQLMTVVPVEEEIKSNQVALPYEQVSAIIESSKSFAVNDCVCRKEKELLGKRCDKPMEACLALAPIPDYFKNTPPLNIRPITKEEALEIIKKSEEAGLVHMTSNIAGGHIYICNCCGCCCGVLGTITKFGISNGVNSSYYAVINEEECVSCGVCADERCQVNAIIDNDDVYNIEKEKCIGCGLCISTCPSEAISLVRKNEEDIVKPPKNEKEWFKMRGMQRGVDFSPYE